MTALMPEVTVNGVTISSARIGAEAQNHPAPKGKPGHAWRAAASALVLRELMLQEARARNLTAAPQDIAPGQVETADEALIRQLMDQAIAPEPVDEAAVRAVYDADPGRFRAPVLWEVSHILFAVPPGDAALRASTRAEADAVLTRLLAAPARFADLAQVHSACSSKTAGGRLGQIGPGDTVAEFEAALDLLAPGAITPEPVETRFGFHLIRLDARADGAVLPFEAVRAKLIDAAEKAAWVRAARDFSAALVAAARIEGITIAA